MKIKLIIILLLAFTAANTLEAYSSYYNAMIRTTGVATMMSAGHAENAPPSKGID